MKKGEIYVSHVIGEYIPSPIIGEFTKERTEQAGIAYEPQKYGYAGRENPQGKKFEAIIRFVTPVYKQNKLLGYLTLALDHHHIMDFTDFVNPNSAIDLAIQDASSGDYAFMWDNDFNCISHPRDYFIVGYDAKTGEKVPGWIDATLAEQFSNSKEKNLNKFLQKQPIFLDQSLKKKPNLQQLQIGQVGLDCKYLNFAPQCRGWSQLVGDGGYGSFVIYWSKVYKLTTAAVIPYYTGEEYNNLKRGFGFVTIGANVDAFHSAATKTQATIKTTLRHENQAIADKIAAISAKIYANIKEQITDMSVVTLILIFIVIYVAIYLANNIAQRVQNLLIGTEKIKAGNFEYTIESDTDDELGKLTHSFNEMAHAIKNLHVNLKSKIYHDELTGLRNRRALNEALENSKENTLCIVDIDSFKNINDYYGITAGNYVLKEFAKELMQCSQKDGFELYRIGSDEFALFKNRIYSANDVKQIITELNTFVSKLIFKNDALLLHTKISFTAGVAVGEDDVVEHADLALNEAKHQQVLFMIYDKQNPHMNKHTEYILWKEKIQYAIDNDNIVPYFQPIFDIVHAQNKKYESLIRMIDDEKVISPFMFLNIAKASKLYPQLTKIMIEKSFQTFENQDATFSINISIDDIINADTVDFLREKIKSYHVEEKLILEILETEEIENFEKVLPFIQEMRKLGVRFAIDDFGSGYSNFSYILQIKPEFLKIDGSLIKNIQKDSQEYYVVGAIVKFAKALNIKVIAEFVSTRATYEILKEFDIDYMQGYYFSEPKENLDQ